MLEDTAAQLRGKVAIVTGAGAGLGRAAALALAEAGVSVVGMSIDETQLRELRTTTRLRRLTVECLRVDVASEAAVAEAMITVRKHYSRVDFLINNAAIIDVRPIEETPVQVWDRVMATNLRSAFLLCREVVPLMKGQGAGVIVNVSSRSGVEGFIGESAYCPSKFGLEGLTRTLALELSPSGVKVVSVTPGAPMRTPMSMTTYPEELRAVWRDPSELASGFVVLVTELGPNDSGGRFDLWRLAQTRMIGESRA
jgi:NAD(P)-dependent dehydrogenase (short-subunit alcohol dehydrogenase family)